jgi:hypothetical protein
MFCCLLYLFESKLLSQSRDYDDSVRRKPTNLTNFTINPPFLPRFFL